MRKTAASSGEYRFWKRGFRPVRLEDVASQFRPPLRTPQATFVIQCLETAVAKSWADVVVAGSFDTYPVVLEVSLRRGPFYWSTLWSLAFGSKPVTLHELVTTWIPVLDMSPAKRCK